MRYAFQMVCLVLAVVGCLSSLAGADPTRPALGKKSAKPNIILFYTDDQGWSDTSVQMMAGRADSRSDIYHTPHLERLASEGMVLSNAYSPSPVCSSSRDSILYGKTPARLHHSILLGKANCSADALTTPRAIKAVNSDYVTAHFGKWACSPKTPEEAGFDVSDGRTDNWHGDWRHVDGQKTTLPTGDPKRIFSVTERANQFMEQQVDAGRPFYMRVSHYAVHVSYLALPETVEKYVAAGLDEPAAIYAAMTENLDSSLGMLLDKLESLGIQNNTYVIFTSDNGGFFRRSGPLRGGKATLWEGGIRVPTVVRGPSVRPGTYCDIPATGWDLLPTFYELAGGSDSLPVDLDGGSLCQIFREGNQGEVHRGVDSLYFHYPWFDNIPMSAVRRGDYKLVKDLNTQECRLFNVTTDIGEENDLAKKMPEISNRLHRDLQSYLEAVNAETIEELRVEREQNLHQWIERDIAIISKLQKQISETVNLEEKQSLWINLQETENRLEGKYAALVRVAEGRQTTAW